MHEVVGPKQRRGEGLGAQWKDRGLLGRSPSLAGWRLLPGAYVSGDPWGQSTTQRAGTF